MISNGREFSNRGYRFNDKYFKNHDDNFTQTKSENSGSCSKKNPLVYISTTISSFLEKFFYRLGIYIGCYPLAFIIFSIAISIVCAGGLSQFREEVENIWVPGDSIAVANKEKARSWFPSGSRDRIQFNLFEAENVLKPSVLLEIFDFESKVKDISGKEKGNYSWDSLCKNINGDCAISSVVELWKFNRTAISELTDDKVLDAINTKPLISPYQGKKIEISRILGGITRDKTTGKIITAKAAKTSYTLNFTETNVEAGRKIDENALAWEEKFIDLSAAYSSKNITIYYYSMRTFLDEGSGTILKDLGILAGGYILLIAFVIFVLGKRNCVEHRVWVSVVGILTIGFSILWSFGLCSYGDWYFTGLHNILPFLFLGIGVDDIFIIVQALDNVKSDSKLPMHEKIGLALKHAGVSITITSLTDVLAFAVGSSTILPALRSFCVYAAVGILGLFLFQVTFFTPFLALDEARRSGMSICKSLWGSQTEIRHLRRDNMHRKNACLPLYIHAHWEPTECSKKSLIPTFFEKYFSKLVTMGAFQANAVVLAFGILSVMIYGTVSLKQDFDPRWFFPSDSYATKYIKADERHFGGTSQQPAAIYVGDIGFHKHLTTLEDICEKISSHYWVKTGSLNCWATGFRDYLNSSQKDEVKLRIDSNGLPKTANDSRYLISLFANDNPRNSPNMVFRDGDLIATRMPYQNIQLETSSKRIDALNDLRRIASNGIPPKLSFPYAEGYANIDTDKVIKDELMRNIGLAFLAVYLITLVLLANFTCSIYVSCCVIMTLIDLAGMMYFWDLTIDTVTTIILVISIGLSVDYAVHIAHTFLITKGSRKERVQKTLSTIGAAVFYGGFSTFLAFILLALSKSYVFKTFFKVFLGVVIFGLFHGLCLLPIVLAWIGPKPYSHEDVTNKNNRLPSRKRAPRMADFDSETTEYNYVRRLRNQNNYHGNQSESQGYTNYI